jgi:peptidylprolyl isomerase
MRVVLAAAAALACMSAAAEEPAKHLTMGEIIAASKPDEWRAFDPADMLVMTLSGGRTIVIALAPAFARNTVANIKILVAQRYFDGLAINRVQDNFVTQWGDPNAEDAARKRPFGAAAPTISPEFTRPFDKRIAFTRLPDTDGFARHVGFVESMPAAHDRRAMWLSHCTAMVGVGRDVAAESGNGAELYAVIGHAPRQLDRNITLVGRVIHGLEHLSSLPRGIGALGFYEKPEQRTPIVSVRLATETPGLRYETLRTDSASFKALVEARRNRRDEWYKVPAGHIDLCNVPLPVRAISPKPQ